MLFSIEHDEGHRITAYVVPDGFSGVPTVRLVSGGVDVFTCSANEDRQALVDAGRHETGRCGFNIGTELVPDLADLHDLTIIEQETDLLIYRRPQPLQIGKKILRLETHLFPLWRFDENFRDKAQYFQKGLEQFGRETVTQMLLLNGIRSVYLSGRISYRSFAYWIEDGFETTIMLQDPYEELAERLLVLSLLGDAAPRYLGPRDAARFAPAIAYAAAMPTSERQLRHHLMDMPSSVAGLFTDPLVRQLTTSNPDDMATGGAIGAALDVLASCAVVGLRKDPVYFAQAVAGWLELDPQTLATTPDFPRVPPLAALLRESRAVDHLLERDFEVFEAVKNAYGAG